ncbi:unnamed protein product [Lactuca saligna]|uniref:Uncharacterized protein n=1 Tax=Lactuca saligna TaxID=75948 RepID=A0AA36EKM6_LACSI|nr:unnamed protein product [Lactuca saligna]
MDRYGRVLTVEEFQLLQERFGLLPEHGVVIPAKGSSVYDYPQGKMGLIFEQDTPKKNWQRQWLWVKQNLVGHGFRKTRDFIDRTPKLFIGNVTLGKQLGYITVIGENWEDFIIIAAAMSASRRARGKMAQLFVVRCAEISLEMAMCRHYRGKLCHREVELLETLPPPVSEKCMKEVIGLFSVKERNVGSSGLSLPSQPVVGAIFTARFSASDSADIPVVAQVGKGTTPILKK